MYSHSILLCKSIIQLLIKVIDNHWTDIVPYTRKASHRLLDDFRFFMFRFESWYGMSEFNFCMNWENFPAGRFFRYWYNQQSNIFLKFKTKIIFIRLWLFQEILVQCFMAEKIELSCKECSVAPPADKPL